MPLAKSTTLSFLASDFKGIKPSYVTSQPGVSTQVAYSKGILYANKSVILELGDTNYKYITFDVTYNGGASFAGISFSTSNGSAISIGKNLDDLFIPFNTGQGYGYDIKLVNGVKKRIYVIVNCGPIGTELLNIEASLGNSTQLAGNSITVEYDCNGPLYEYTTGVHAYSPYDAANSPKLTTKLYSRFSESTWANGNRVWAKKDFLTLPIHITTQRPAVLKFLK